MMPERCFIPWPAVPGTETMHDLSESSVEAALQLVELLEEEGYCFVTVSELAALRGQTMTPGNVYTDFREK